VEHHFYTETTLPSSAVRSYAVGHEIGRRPEVLNVMLREVAFRAAAHDALLSPARGVRCPPRGVLPEVIDHEAAQLHQ